MASLGLDRLELLCRCPVDDRRIMVFDFFFLARLSDYESARQCSTFEPVIDCGPLDSILAAQLVQPGPLDVVSYYGSHLVGHFGNYFILAIFYPDPLRRLPA